MAVKHLQVAASGRFIVPILLPGSAAALAQSGWGVSQGVGRGH